MSNNPVYDAAVQAAASHFHTAEDRATFLRQMKQEAGFKRGRTSGKGAGGPAQIMPDTAAAWGVHDVNNASEAYNAAAKHMAAYLHQYGGSWKDALTAYNAGPGRVGKPLFAETQHYIATILNGKGDAKAGSTSTPSATLSGGGTVTPGKPVTVTPGSTSIDFDGALTDSLLANASGRHKGGSLLKQAQALVAGGGYTTTTAPKINDGTAPTFTPGSTVTSAGSSGSSADDGSITGFAKSRVGHYKETTGSNRGPELDQLEARFGMKGQAWCAMFATTAATHGGASRAIRTASVAQINSWAAAGANGYEKGLRSDRDAQAGDLLTFGNDHVGYVVGRTDKGVETIEGNNSNGQVNRRFHPYGSGRIARPKR